MTLFVMLPTTQSANGMSRNVPEIQVNSPTLEQKKALRQELFGLTILSVFYLVHNGFNLSYMAQLEMVLTK